MDLELQGKQAVVTGGSRGIGLAVAKTLAAEGCDVTIVATSETALSDAAEKIQRETGRSVASIAANLAEHAQRLSLREVLERADILVNNAGAVPGGGFEQIDAEAWKAAFDLKVFGYFELSRLALEPMMSRGSGVIVNVIGMAAVTPRYDYLCGATANAAVANFTKALGGYSTRAGVRVVAVNPGATETERLEPLYRRRAQLQLGDAERWRELFADLPFGRAATPQEIADVVVYLASARASYLSGIVVDADAGAAHRRA